MADSVDLRLAEHWRSLRGRAYDLLDLVSADDLAARLPFSESQSMYYQLWCMTGAQESWLPLLTTGAWAGFSCSLDGMPGNEGDPATIKRQMQAADKRLEAALSSRDPLEPFGNGTRALDHYLGLVEHESHHHGQLINFIYANGWLIPDSWARKWALSRD